MAKVCVYCLVVFLYSGDGSSLCPQYSFRFLTFQTFVLKAYDFECDSKKATWTHCRIEKQFHGWCSVKAEERPCQVTRGLCVNLITYYTR